MPWWWPFSRNTEETADESSDSSVTLDGSLDAEDDVSSDDSLGEPVYEDEEQQTVPASPSTSRSSSAYSPTYSPTSPHYEDVYPSRNSSAYSPTYSPTSPHYEDVYPSRNLPAYSPTSPHYEDVYPSRNSPAYSPTSPQYEDYINYITNYPQYQATVESVSDEEYANLSRRTRSASAPRQATPITPPYVPAPRYDPTAPRYNTRSPVYVASPPQYYPTSPEYHPTSPRHPQRAPSHPSMSPQYNPLSPYRSPLTPPRPQTPRRSPSARRFFQSPIYAPNSPRYRGEDDSEQPRPSPRRYPHRRTVSSQLRDDFPDAEEDIDPFVQFHRQFDHLLELPDHLVDNLNVPIKTEDDDDIPIKIEDDDDVKIKVDEDFEDDDISMELDDDIADDYSPKYEDDEDDEEVYDGSIKMEEDGGYEYDVIKTEDDEDDEEIYDVPIKADDDDEVNDSQGAPSDTAMPGIEFLSESDEEDVPLSGDFAILHRRNRQRSNIITWAFEHELDNLVRRGYDMTEAFGLVAGLFDAYVDEYSAYDYDLQTYRAWNSPQLTSLLNFLRGEIIETGRTRRAFNHRRDETIARIRRIVLNSGHPNAGLLANMYRELMAANYDPFYIYRLQRIYESQRRRPMTPQDILELPASMNSPEATLNEIAPGARQLMIESWNRARRGDDGYGASYRSPTTPPSPAFGRGSVSPPGPPPPPANTPRSPTPQPPPSPSTSRSSPSHSSWSTPSSRPYDSSDSSDDSSSNTSDSDSNPPSQTSVSSSSSSSHDDNESSSSNNDNESSSSEAITPSPFSVSPTPSHPSSHASSASPTPSQPSIFSSPPSSSSSNTSDSGSEPPSAFSDSTFAPGTPTPTPSPRSPLAREPFDIYMTRNRPPKRTPPRKFQKVDPLRYKNRLSTPRRLPDTPTKSHLPPSPRRRGPKPRKCEACGKAFRVRKKTSGGGSGQRRSGRVRK